MTDSGSAVQDADDDLEVLGAGTVSVSASGNTITITGSASALTFATDSGSAAEAGDTINFNGAGGFVFSGSGSTVTGTQAPLVINADSGSATESGNALTFTGGGGLTVSGSGSTVSLNQAAPPSAVFEWSAQQLGANPSAFAPTESITTTNIKQYIRAYARDVLEENDAKITVPDDIDTSGTVTFEVVWFARVVPGASEDVIWQIKHAAVADGEDLDSFSYTTEKAAASGTGTTQNDQIYISWTETVSNLAWTAGDVVYLLWGRDGTDGNDTFNNNGTAINDDALMVKCKVTIPLSVS